jgi:hypothetical protein
VAYRIGKQKEPHAIGEVLVKPCALEMVKLSYGLEQRKILETAPLCNNVIRSRIVYISFDVLKHGI